MTTLDVEASTGRSDVRNAAPSTSHTRSQPRLGFIPKHPGWLRRIEAWLAAEQPLEQGERELPVFTSTCQPPPLPKRTKGARATAPFDLADRVGSNHHVQATSRSHVVPRTLPPSLSPVAANLPACTGSPTSKLVSSPSDAQRQLDELLSRSSTNHFIEIGVSTLPGAWYLPYDFHNLSTHYNLTALTTHDSRTRQIH